MVFLLVITDRDKELFNLIAVSGCCTIKQAAKIFEKPGGYHYKRIQKLCEEGYLIKRGKYLELTTASSEVIGSSKYRFIREDRDTHIEVANIALSGLRIISNRELRTQYGLNRKTHFKGAIEYKGLYYFFYLLPAQPTKQLISFIKSELRTYSASGICRYAVVFAPTPTALGMFTVEDCKQNELFLLPYPAGLNYLHNYLSDHMQNYLKSYMPQAVKSKAPFANYEDSSYYYTIMVLNDIAKRYYLSAYYQSPSQNKPVKIICLESQVNLFTSLFPQTELIILPEEKFRKAC